MQSYLAGNNGVKRFIEAANLGALHKLVDTRRSTASSSTSARTSPPPKSLGSKKYPALCAAPDTRYWNAETAAPAAIC
jgi:hypothetical protein